ncbi:unnamed protein product [Vitrella brassicaformis CCMP3155]|uniref:Uncharacterized protein n=2 Tax=Vitrella brassicaformis TaxID=1169539 RepID=A0A0G4FGU9_VITBC|nr:unnamed protein product [Vitrella brassicaformis CCMP3155]|mmetsp:Transcript_24527/g.60621  ORF Transcript_24527/g.60621 Transcript_24527/m.60621 type:complete len:220 (+) Transcript_24527:52-711(+)|eukprot:CEM12674.1 unnamed protein product [Vitrella brassicaformis CCMP3155]
MSEESSSLDQQSGGKPNREAQHNSSAAAESSSPKRADAVRGGAKGGLPNGESDQHAPHTDSSDNGVPPHGGRKRTHAEAVQSEASKPTDGTSDHPPPTLPPEAAQPSDSSAADARDGPVGLKREQSAADAARSAFAGLKKPAEEAGKRKRPRKDTPPPPKFVEVLKSAGISLPSIEEGGENEDEQEGDEEGTSQQQGQQDAGEGRDVRAEGAAAKAQEG